MGMDQKLLMWLKQCHKPSPKSPEIGLHKPFPNGWFILVLTTLFHIITINWGITIHSPAITLGTVWVPGF
jgi:hypothetical protein